MLNIDDVCLDDCFYQLESFPLYNEVARYAWGVYFRQNLLGPERCKILKIQLVVASTAIKRMLMDVIFDETHVRTCSHRIYKRYLVSVKKN